MSLTKQFSDLGRGNAETLSFPDLDGDCPHGARATDPDSAEQSLARCGQRHHYDVVLVLARRVLPLAVKDANDDEGYTLDPNRLTDRILLAEQVIGGSLSDNGHFGSDMIVLPGDRTAFKHPPILNLEPLGGNA